jgi:alpha-1,2-mannosyltransferase
MGYSFTLGLCKWLFPTVPTAAYVHYPTISTDMLSSLDSDASSNQGLHAGAGEGLRGSMKRRYWQLFAKAYGYSGKFVDVVMTNSSWTKSHIQELWGPSRATAEDISVIFPPVAVSDLEQKIDVSAASEASRQPHLLYIAQFRPVKNHPLILTAFSELLASRGDWTASTRPRLVFVGSVRDRDDATRVYKLRLQAHELQIKDDVEFVCDASWPQVLGHLRRSSVGVNGMWNEHFGIGVVEYQASGLISVVNDSGGPKMDIVVDVDGGPTGTIVFTGSAYILTPQAFMRRRVPSMQRRLRARWASVLRIRWQCDCGRARAREDSARRCLRSNGCSRWRNWWRFRRLTREAY